LTNAQFTACDVNPAIAIGNHIAAVVGVVSVNANRLVTATLCGDAATHGAAVTVTVTVDTNAATTTTAAAAAADCAIIAGHELRRQRLVSFRSLYNVRLVTPV
jgi:hypothetical protein